MTPAFKRWLCAYLDVQPMTFYRWETGIHKVPRMARLACRKLPELPNYLKMTREDHEILRRIGGAPPNPADHVLAPGRPRIHPRPEFPADDQEEGEENTDARTEQFLNETP